MENVCHQSTGWLTAVQIESSQHNIDSVPHMDAWKHNQFNQFIKLPIAKREPRLYGLGPWQRQPAVARTRAQCKSMFRTNSIYPHCTHQANRARESKQISKWIQVCKPIDDLFFFFFLPFFFLFCSFGGEYYFNSSQPNQSQPRNIEKKQNK